MPLIAANYKWFHSTNKLGGAMTATPWQNGVKHDLFDKFSPAETTTGGTFYRAVFFQNKHASITMEDIKLYIDTISPSPDTEVSIGLAVEAKNLAIEAIANETTAPAGVTFSAPITQGAGLSPVNLLKDDYVGIWLKFVVNAAAAAKANDGFTLAAYAAYTE